MEKNIAALPQASAKSHHPVMPMHIGIPQDRLSFVPEYSLLSTWDADMHRHDWVGFIGLDKKIRTPRTLAYRISALNPMATT